ncbi:MAG TPA: hypothetical protein VLB47_03910, partial [Solirubrobacteraceae bacterium]|nr:hypothetical protein [Solirubrobacteraceae bacterium]
MLHRLLTGTAAVVAVLVPAAATQAAPAVSVRVEGVQRTLLPATSVAQSGQAPPVSGCDGSSAGAALDRATGGDWDRQPFASTILGEAHDFSAGDYWAEWIGRGGGFVFGAGLCSDELQAGDELLMLVDVTAAPDYASTAFPLAVRDVPARVAPGVPFTVRVRRWRPDAQGTPGSGVEEAAAGAAVEVAGRSVAADAEGRATLALPARGPAEVRAVATTTRSASVPLCVTDGADGACGTAAGGGPSAAPAPAPPCATTG